MDYIMIHIKDNYKNKIFSKDKMSQFCLIEIDKFIEDMAEVHKYLKAL